jgi:hypothetical protein
MIMCQIKCHNHDKRNINITYGTVREDDNQQSRISIPSMDEKRKHWKNDMDMELVTLGSVVGNI